MCGDWCMAFRAAGSYSDLEDRNLMAHIDPELVRRVLHFNLPTPVNPTFSNGRFPLDQSSALPSASSQPTMSARDDRLYCLRDQQSSSVFGALYNQKSFASSAPFHITPRAEVLPRGVPGTIIT
jgi:hypothetical protein